MGRIAKTVIISALCAPVVLAAGVAGLYFWPRYHQRIIISRKTTYITKPLRPDGLPDYTAVINKFGGGLRVQDNAFIPIFYILSDNGHALGFGWRREINILGPNPFRGREPPLEPIATFFRDHLPPNLRIEQNAAKLVPHCKYLWDDPDTATTFAWLELDRAGRGPWNHKGCPLLFRYITSNHAVLDRIDKLVKLPGYFQPLYRRNPKFPIFGAPDLSSRLDGLAQELLARANLRLARNNVAGCEADLIAIHRLSRLITQRQLSVAEYVSAASLDQYATNGDRILMRYPRLSARQAEEYTRRLCHLAHFSPMFQAVNIGSRFNWLQMCIGGYEQSRESPFVIGRLIGSLTNWNDVLRRMNRSYSKLAGYFRRPIYSPQGRQIALGLKRYAARLKSSGEFAFGGRVVKWSWIIATNAVDMAMLRRVKDWKIASGRLTRIGFALTAYRLRRGRYPKTLTALCPQYLPSIPVNPLTGKAPSYIRTTSGVRLTSPDPFSKNDPHWELRRKLLLEIPAPALKKRVQAALP
jgi:hypothetical protein